MKRFRSDLKKLRLKQKGKEKLRLKQKGKEKLRLKQKGNDAAKILWLKEKRDAMMEVALEKPECYPNPDPDDEEKLRLKQKEMDAIDAAELAGFCQFIDENITVYTNDTYPDNTVDIKQRELEEQLEELEVLEVFEKIRNGTLSNNAGYCPVCKKKNYNCDHYHYNKRWKSYSLISCFICRSQGEHWASGCPYLHDKRVHPLWGRRY